MNFVADTNHESSRHKIVGDMVCVADSRGLCRKVVVVEFWLKERSKASTVRIARNARNEDFRIRYFLMQVT